MLTCTSKKNHAADKHKAHVFFHKKKNLRLKKRKHPRKNENIIRKNRATSLPNFRQQEMPLFLYRRNGNGDNATIKYSKAISGHPEEEEMEVSALHSLRQPRNSSILPPDSLLRKSDTLPHGYHFSRACIRDCQLCFSNKEQRDLLFPGQRPPKFDSGLDRHILSATDFSRVAQPQSCQRLFVVGPQEP